MATIKAEYYRLNGSSWDKYYFKTTTDMVENFKSDSAVPLGSKSDFVNGTLILTDISSANGPSWRIEVMGKPYTAIGTPIHFTIESYNYDGQFYAPASKGLSYGYRMPPVTILDYQGKVAIWFPRLQYWNSFIATAYETISEGYIRNRVISYLDIAKPASTKTREVVLEQLATEGWVTSNTRSSIWTPTWAQVSDKPTWIGASKPLYTYDEVGARSENWYPSWSDVNNKPTTFSPSTHNHNQLYNTAGDTRSTPTLPTDYNNVLKISGYKDSSAVGRAGSLMGVNGYADPSGGVLELSWNNNRLSFRTSKNSAEWNTWGEVASEQWVTSNTRSSSWTPTWDQVTSKPSGILRQVDYNNGMMIVEVL